MDWPSFLSSGESLTPKHLAYLFLLSLLSLSIWKSLARRYKKSLLAFQLQEKYAKIREKYNLTQNGFLPLSCAEQLPGYYNEWEAIAKKLPELNRKKQVRKAIDGMRLLSCRYLDNEAVLRRAYMMLGMMVHSYVNGCKVPWELLGDDDDDDVMEETSDVQEFSKELPAQLAIPWCNVCIKLDLPFVLTAAIDIWNWKLKDPSKPIMLCNLTNLLSMTGTSLETNFHMVPCAMHATVGPFIPRLFCFHDIASGSSDDVISFINEMTRIFKEFKRILSEVNHLVDADMFYNVYRPMLAGFWPDGIDFKLNIDIQNKSIDPNDNDFRHIVPNDNHASEPSKEQELVPKDRQQQACAKNSAKQKDCDIGASKMYHDKSATKNLNCAKVKDYVLDHFDSKENHASEPSREQKLDTKDRQQQIFARISVNQQDCAKNTVNEHNHDNIGTNGKYYDENDTKDQDSAEIISDEIAFAKGGTEEGLCANTGSTDQEASGESSHQRIFENVGSPVQDCSAGATSGYFETSQDLKKYFSKHLSGSKVGNQRSRCQHVLMKQYSNGDVKVNSKGSNAGQSTMFLLFDLLLGIQHWGPGKEFQNEMLDYMIPDHRQIVIDFADLVSKHGSLRDIVLDQRSSHRSEAIKAFNECVQSLVSFRAGHLGIAVKYLIRTKIGLGASSFKDMLNDMLKGTKSVLINEC